MISRETYVSLSNRIQSGLMLLGLVTIAPLLSAESPPDSTSLEAPQAQVAARPQAASSKDRYEQVTARIREAVAAGEISASEGEEHLARLKNRQPHVDETLD